MSDSLRNMLQERKRNEILDAAGRGPEPPKITDENNTEENCEARLNWLHYQHKVVQRKHDQVEHEWRASKQYGGWDETTEDGEDYPGQWEYQEKSNEIWDEIHEILDN